MIKMRERKYVKFRVDMLSDTKFKIIDTKPERDLIHYVWMALVLLAGKVNLAGELYISKNMPYTLETLAIEFGREIEQVKLALDVLIELEMIELTEHNIKNEEVEVKEEMINKSLEINDDKDENKVNIVQNDSVTHLTSIDNNDKGSIEVTKSQTINNKNKDNISDSNIYKKNVDCDKMEVNPSLENNIPILLESKKGKRTAKKKNTIIDFVDEEKEEEPLFRIVDGDDEIPLREGERVVGHWHF
jgi:predicted phage replisome organizer